MRWNKAAFGLIIFVLCWLAPISGAAPEPQLTIYTSQASYSISVMDRAGKPYISVTDLLVPLGASSPHLKNKEWRMQLNKAEVRIIQDKEKATINGHQADMGGKALVEEGRVLVPLDAALPLLSRLLNTTVDFHRPARRIFVGNGFTHFYAQFKNQDRPSLVLNFSQPVKPEISHDQDRTTLVFRREPVVSEANRQRFGDGAIQSLIYREDNGVASLVITGNAALEITRSDDGKTITLQPENPATAALPEPTPQNVPDAGEAQKHAPEFFVMIDPSHGGSDKGANFGGKVLEKDITLRLARELRKELEERGIASHLLRDGDIEIGIERRAEITNEQHAAMYIALHAGLPGHGVRVYSPLLTDPQPTNGRFLPWQSAQSGALVRSQSAAQAITAEIRKKGIAVTGLGIPLRPLNNIVVPAIAVELAPGDSGLQSLENQKRQNTVAAAIASGVAQVRSQMGVRP